MKYTTHKKTSAIKQFLLLLLIAGLGTAFFSSAEAKVKVQPYYSLNIGEAVSLPSVGEWLFSLNLSNDLGVVVVPNEDHKFFGFYELKYTGPGLKKQEGEKFTDRYMGHVCVVKHSYRLNDDYTLKSQLDYMKELKRTGSNELWGRGLYDFDRYGCGVSVSRVFDEDFKASAGLSLHHMDFPNYTDLLSEVQSSSGTAEVSTGKQNQNIIQLGLKASYLTYEGEFALMFLNYTKQKVVSETPSADGSYYSGQLQSDMGISLNIRDYLKPLQWLAVSPQLGFSIKNSNQNYLYFSSPTATVPAAFYGNYYSYREVSFLLPVNCKLSKKWEFYISPEWYLRTYSDRPPRDGANNYLTGRHYTDLFLLNWGFVFRGSDFSTTTFYFGYQVQSSNTKFEKYAPYNYNGSVFGINFNFTY